MSQSSCPYLPSKFSIPYYSRSLGDWVLPSSTLVCSPKLENQALEGKWRKGWGRGWRLRPLQTLVAGFPLTHPPAKQAAPSQLLLLACPYHLPQLVGLGSLSFFFPSLGDLAGPAVGVWEGARNKNRSEDIQGGPARDLGVLSRWTGSQTAPLTFAPCPGTGSVWGWHPVPLAPFPFLKRRRGLALLTEVFSSSFSDSETKS